MSLDKPNVLAIVIFPYRDKSLCDHKLNNFLTLISLSTKFTWSHKLNLYEKAVPKATIGLCGHINSNGVSLFCTFFPNHKASVLEELSLSPLHSSNKLSTSSSFSREASSLQKAVVSSAYCDNLISLLATRIPLISD